MILKAFAFLPLLLVPLDFRIDWSDSSYQAINVLLSGYNETVERCIQSGLEVRYRYELQLCRRRTMWFHSCKDKTVVLRTLEFDPITQHYKVLRDTLGDGRSGLSSRAASLEEGLSALSSVSGFPLDVLTDGDDSFMEASKLYVSARVVATCRGQYNETLARIGYLLTLGLVKISALNTGWIDFNLDRGAER